MKCVRMERAAASLILCLGEGEIRPRPQAAANHEVTVAFRRAADVMKLDLAPRPASILTLDSVDQETDTGEEPVQQRADHPIAEVAPSAFAIRSNPGGNQNKLRLPIGQAEARSAGEAQFMDWRRS